MLPIFIAPAPTSMLALEAPLVGRTLAHYEITAFLGKGGMGEVYRARDTKLKRDVALKFLNEELKHDHESRRRLLREARSAAAIDHPYACKTYEVGEVDGVDYIAMEYLEGETLAARLAKGPLTPGLAVEMVSEVAEALAKAHSLRIIHRDMKPSNIMLCPDGHVKVMDFGMAKWLSRPDAGPEQETLTVLTRSDSLMGTPGYMSPEQIRGEPLGPASDIFSLGIILHESLSGRNPFKHKNLVDCLTAILHDAPPALPAALNPALGRILGTMLAKDPAVRYQSASALLTGLRQLEIDRTRSTGRAAKRQRSALISIIALIAVLGALAILRGAFRDHAKTVDIVGMQARDYEDRAKALMQNFSDPEDLLLSIEAWQKVVELEGESAPALAGLATARAYYAWSSVPGPETLDDAQREAERSIRLDPGYAESYSALAIVFEMRGLFDTADELFRKSIDIGPDDPLVLQARARFLMDYKGNFAEAEQLAAKATRLSPDYYPAWFQLGWAQMELEHITEAKSSFQAAIDLKPNFAAAYLGLGMCLNAEGRFDAAKETFDKALAVDPHSIQAQFYQGMTYHHLGLPAESLACFSRVVESSPNHPLAPHGLLYMAVEYRRLGRYAASDSVLGKAEREFKRDPKSGWALEGLAGVSAIRGRTDESLAWLSKAVANGFRSKIQIRLDPALEPLADNPGFQKILNGISTPQSF